jgi:3'-phosphoadenosine 5'-phosphosulfate sulfotransferase (PAPS reductase)/FAD synthetase
MANKHSAYDLAQIQSLPLEAKIIMTQQRIRQWYEHWGGMVYVSFSGGKDSTVLKHIVDSMYDDVPSVFVNTGLEYPEIQQFVRSIKDGKFDCFNSDVEIVRPKMRFDEVLKKYGYPVISKTVSHSVKIAKRNPDGKVMRNVFDPQNKGRFGLYKWKFLIDSDIPTSEECCNVMKKSPSKKYSKDSGRMPILGTMADESSLRYSKWLQNGCNSFEGRNPTSQPLSFWTAQDILHYIKKFNVPYCSVYGDIVIDEETEIEGQINIIDCIGEYEPEDRLKTTGCDRTGCIFCMFGCHLEKEPNRFQRLKKTHPRQYEYCIKGGEMVDEKWQPSKEGLGLGKVLDYIGVKYD